MSNRAPVHTGNGNSGTIFVPEQDCSDALLKVERIVLDRFLKRFGTSLSTFVGVKITTGLTGGFEATITGSKFDPNTTQPNLFSSPCFPGLRCLSSFLKSVGWRMG